MIHIQVDHDYWSFVKTSDLRKAARTAGFVANLPGDSECTVVITGDDQVHSLNSEFRQVDDTTDVLSFPVEEKDPDTNKLYLGDVIISYPRAFNQASSTDHSTSDELMLLTIHGILHLAGYDHIKPEDKAVMYSLQNEALNRLGLSIKGFNT